MFYYPIIWYNNKTINYKPLAHIAALPDDGRNYRPKHVVNVTEKWIYNHL
jgi:hypothetical protein